MVDRMPIPAGLVTRTMVVVRPVKGHVSVHDARTDLAVVSVQWGEIYMRFTSAAQVSAVLAAFGDQVLFLKHNLNARAIASLDSTLGELEDEIAVLIGDMEASIAEANAFIDEMGGDRQ